MFYYIIETSSKTKLKKGMDENMKKKIALYNILTTVFALLTLVSFGGFTSGGSIINTIINVALFSILTKKCYDNENKLRKILRNKLVRARKRKHIYLENYKRNKKYSDKKEIS